MSSPPRISAEEVARIASLARIDLRPEEVTALAGDLDRILDYAAAVAAIDTAGVAPLAHPLGLTNVLRPDEAGPTLPWDEVAAAAPETADGRFVVPRILGEEA